jgi:hypothetical protein
VKDGKSYIRKCLGLIYPGGMRKFVPVSVADIRVNNFRCFVFVLLLLSSL